VQEIGLTVVAHAGDSGYSSNGYAHDGFAAGFSSHGGWRPNVKSLHIERAAHDFLITLVFDKLFERFPALRIVGRERARLPVRISSRSCAAPTTRYRATSPRIRPSPFGATSGSTHSGRTTCTTWSSTWVPTA
jgi:hypothetical protein